MALEECRFEFCCTVENVFSTARVIAVVYNENDDMSSDLYFDKDV